ncbi:unnamed protein product [Colias eurytheme]|nr:unnamed protein product [Colias eurytheme]
MLMTSLTALGDTNEINCWENRPFMKSWPENKQNNATKSHSVTKVIKKKNKRNRTAYTTDQLRVLERTYIKTKYIDAERRKELAQHLNIGEKCIKVWFQNRRMKEKKESSESSCDSSSESNAFEPITPPPPANITEDITISPNFNTNYSHDIPQTYQNTTQNYVFPTDVNQNGYDYNAAQFYNNFAPENYDYNNCGYYFQNERNVYPTQYYPNDSTPYYNANDFTQYCNYENWNVNGFETVSYDNGNGNGLQGM